MAAYAALVSLAHTTDLLLNSDEPSLSVDEEANVRSIREFALFLVSFLEDFPEKCSRLEGKFRDVANEAEVLLEDFMWKHNRLSWWSSLGLSRHEFEKQLGKVREEFFLIVGEAMDERFVIDSAADAAAVVSSSNSADTSGNDVLIGLDDDLMAIKDRLCGLSTKLQFIPIVGMGGIGKTTLSRKAYDDALIVGYFHIRAWITVSQDYSARRVLSSLVDSMNLCLRDKVLGEVIGEDVMAEKVYKNLKGRRYLVVIDDIWSTNVWDDLRKLFPDDGNGSRIMLTTRLSNVGGYVDPLSPLHRMQFMDGDRSWDLLKQKVCCPSELEDVGKDIARSCGGLPLAIVLVGGILFASNTSRASWQRISKNITSVVNGQVDRILSLSYTHLPQHLRPCFLLTGVCPEDYRIHVSRLIKLWVAEGFLKGESRYRSIEDEAEKYLEDLVKRNLVLVVKRTINGKIKSCRLHDLVRDMCRRKANEEKFRLHVIENYAFPEILNDFPRHLKRERDPTISSMSSQKIAACQRLDIIRNFRLQRAFDVIDYHARRLPSDYHARRLPSLLFELFQLRYLALNYIFEIPSSISKLQNLQTLIVCPRICFEWYPPNSPTNTSYLPFEIWRMPQLRHLVFYYCYTLPDPRDGSVLPLENLQTLSVVASLVCHERILKLFPNLKKLGLIYYRNEDYYLHNLIHLHHLEKLKVTTYRKSSWLRQNPRFPWTLKSLTLCGGQLPWKDMAVVGALPNLEVLKLRSLACVGNTWETTGGEFCHLKFLLIEESNLRHWKTETSHFPRLKILVLHHCSILRKIPDGIGEISTLELIEVDDGNESLLDSAEEIKRNQLENYGNDALQVHCVPFAKIKKVFTLITLESVVRERKRLEIKRLPYSLNTL